MSAIVQLRLQGCGDVGQTLIDQSVDSLNNKRNCSVTLRVQNKQPILVCKHVRICFSTCEEKKRAFRSKTTAFENSARRLYGRQQLMKKMKMHERSETQESKKIKSRKAIQLILNPKNQNQNQNSKSNIITEAISSPISAQNARNKKNTLKRCPYACAPSRLAAAAAALRQSSFVAAQDRYSCKSQTIRPSRLWAWAGRKPRTWSYRRRRRGA